MPKNRDPQPKPERSDAEALLDTLLTNLEPPPMAPPQVPHPYANPIPFGAPPEEPVTLAPDEIPWELREE